MCKSASFETGNLETQEFGLIDEERPEEGVKLTYRAGTQCDGRTGRSLEYHLLCNPAMPIGEPAAIAGDCRFIVTWETALACPIRPRSVAAYAACAAAAILMYLVAAFLCNGFRSRDAAPRTAHVRAAAGLLAERVAAAAGTPMFAVACALIYARSSIDPQTRNNEGVYLAQDHAL